MDSRDIHFGRRYHRKVKVTIELDREDDGRWIAETLELPNLMCCGQTRDEAISNAKRLAIEVIGDRIAHRELPSSSLGFPSPSRTSNWPASKARRVLAALERIGWRMKRQRGSHRLVVQTGRMIGRHRRNCRLQSMQCRVLTIGSLYV